MTSLRQLPGSAPKEKKAFCPNYGGFVSGIKKDLSVCNVFRIYLWALEGEGFCEHLQMIATNEGLLEF